jgi:hypothetical protein
MDKDVRAKIEAAIEAAIDADASTIAEWGVDDCALWVANILRAAFPRDPGKSFRGKYSDREGAYEAIGKRGITGIVAGQARRFGWKRLKDVEQAKLGDIGVLKNPEGTQTVCLKYRGRFWIARGVQGTAFVPDGRVSRAWSIA